MSSARLMRALYIVTDTWPNPDDTQEDHIHRKYWVIFGNQKNNALDIVIVPAVINTIF